MHSQKDSNTNGGLITSMTSFGYKEEQKHSEISLMTSLKNSSNEITDDEKKLFELKNQIPLAKSDVHLIIEAGEE